MDTHSRGRGGTRESLVGRWESWAPNSGRRILWDIAVFAAVLRQWLAVLDTFEHNGFTVHAWAAVDREGRQADSWAATAEPQPPQS